MLAIGAIGKVVMHSASGHAPRRVRMYHRAGGEEVLRGALCDSPTGANGYAFLGGLTTTSGMPAPVPVGGRLGKCPGTSPETGVASDVNAELLGCAAVDKA